MSSRNDKYDKNRYKYISEIQQMMFVSGEVADPLVETAALIEDIVRSQVIDIIIMAAALAQGRGSRSIASEDLIFLIRHDKSKVARLRTYLSWKDIRKNVRDNGAPETGEEMAEDPNAAEKQEKSRKNKIRLCWEYVNGFPEAMNDSDDEDEEVDELDDTVARLKRADEITRAMTRAQYEHYSECRQASFTFRRGKRFRDWANMSAYIDMKPNEDIIDILGFLTCEMVTKLTELGLEFKASSHYSQPPAPTTTAASRTATSGSNGTAGSATGSGDGTEGEARIGLFSSPPSARTPLNPSHILEAYRRLQNAVHPIQNFRGGLARSQVSLI
ncbi:Transcription initiation protein spt3 [Dimargaris cristalligena]|uniref:Transcription initiation factor IID, 18kD subunit-domain-containing protein n=1 Tax=Dimargaris cristalligena TaxID=215637 RepID=A0A4P9ZUI4_9FUNG|nr:Transcription initiation protein spt3 [Dimargaris cristalligena]RKP37207.1 transcription initiation factor IID, 18kD subunit-domain-containing protein [Dimargaris cristalligena]|eukprot:RKP37207.1 transcription initiation factor IID, 18kD subunit-domain-containing protein [Dimargaris cristalligena]